MLIKLDVGLDALIAEGKLKTKWTELEDHGIAELVHVMFEYHLSEDSVGTTAIIENKTIYLHMYEGVMYEHEGKVYTLAKAYIDTDNNLVFSTPSGELFLYETYVKDAEDPKYYYGNE